MEYNNNNNSNNSNLVNLMGYNKIVMRKNY